MANKPTKAELENRIARALMLLKILATELPFSETIDDLERILKGEK